MLILLSEKLLDKEHLSSFATVNSFKEFVLSDRLSSRFVFYWFIGLTVLLSHASPSIHSSLCMPVCHLCADVCLSVYLSSCLSVRLSIELFVCLSVCLSSFCLSVKLSVFLSQSVKLSVCRSICLSVSLSSCLPISLSFCLPSPPLCIYLWLQIDTQLSISEYKALKNIIYFIHFSHLFPHGSIPLI